MEQNALTQLIAKLGRIRQESRALCYGEYRELMLSNRQFAFARVHDGEEVITAVNNDEQDAEMYIPAQNGSYKGMLTGTQAAAENGKLHCMLPGNSGEIWVKES